MKFDLILAGVGGQGVLSIATVIAAAACEEGIHVKQSEVHGMSQRGGAVLSHLRLSSEPIAGDTVSRGCADMVLAMEPLEALRYVEYLRSSGYLLTAAAPVRNIPDYPPLEEVHQQVRKIRGAVLIAADTIAREQGSIRSVNMVMIGAASNFLPLSPDVLEKTIENFFQTKGEKIVQMNRNAFRCGRQCTI